MADEAEARRRQLRRRKILENAEERKRKIFGTSNPVSATTDNNNKTIKAQQDDMSPQVALSSALPTNVESSPTSACPTSPSNSVISGGPATPTLDTNTPTLGSLDNNNVVEEDVYPELNETSRLTSDPGVQSLSERRITSVPGAQNGTIPNFRDQLLNLNSLLTANGNQEPGNLQNGQFQGEINLQTASARTFKPSLVPICIALLVCALLFCNFGYVVSNSISIPFILWEMHHLWSQRLSIHSSSRNNSGLWGIALVLCGVKQATISAYALILTIFKCFLEDFALYIFTVVLWHSIIGLPVQDPEVIMTPDVPENNVPEDFDF
ncbi:hypothetical protein Pcinc_043060 [Petrolisthes cinctipes]|uniref:Uncharacterized protein n=1 Tax=Petrolisthes cinctipes TaxID=88211 RepID=A0AAE1BJW5_PETCI|nr:hypothetical protein Pcinc_043060 [Petrolisthes cinctipes]